MNVMINNNSIMYIYISGSNLPWIKPIGFHFITLHNMYLDGGFVQKDFD